LFADLVADLFRSVVKKNHAFVIWDLLLRHLCGIIQA
jgi:hypothetical protein